MSSIDYLDLCRLCLVKESAFVPIFDGEGDGRQIFLKIAACLPVKVTRDDKLPKKICNECVQKIELFYQFCNTTTNAEKQLLEWIGGVDLNDKQTYVSAVINQDQSSNNRLDGNVMQQTNEQHQNNIDMNMMESIGLEMPMMIQQNQTQMTINYTNNTNAQSMQSNTAAQQQNNSKNMDDSDDDHCGGDDDMGQNEELSVKEEIHDSNRTIEPAFVNVSIPCEEAGPSGLQQKSGDIPDGQFLAGQSTDGDPKSGHVVYIKEEFHSDNLQMLDEPTIIETDEDGELFNKAMSVEVNDLYECSHCELLFPTEIITKEHELTVHHKKNTNELPCNVCCFKTNTESSLYQDDDETTLTEVSVINDNSENPSESPNLILTESEQNILKEHLANNRVINELDFKCGYCKNRYEDKMDLVKHFESCTTVECQGQVQCRLCYYTDLITRRIHAHYYNSHSTNYFTCNYCNIKFLMLSELLDHKKYNHSNELKLLECDICNKKFTCQKSLDIHTFFHKYESSVFAGFNEKKLFTTIDSKASNETKVNKIHICLECNKQFKNNEDLLEHINDKHDENTPYIKEYPCNECNLKFTLRSDLIKHSKDHRLIYFACQKCGYRTANEKIFDEHIKNHKNKNRLKEKIDDYKRKKLILTSNLKNTKSHEINGNKKMLELINRVDSENESKSCKTFDGKNLTKKSYKEQSAKSSSSYFHCDVCKLSFKFEQMFRKHVETAHNDITYLNKKIYKCSECSLKTIERSVLIKHMRRHSITFETASTIIPKATYSKNIITKDSKSSSKTT